LSLQNSIILVIQEILIIEISLETLGAAADDEVIPDDNLEATTHPHIVVAAYEECSVTGEIPLAEDDEEMEMVGSCPPKQQLTIHEMPTCDMHSASVVINLRDCPVQPSLVSLAGILRSCNASRVLLDHILKWHRQAQLDLLCEVSADSFPQRCRLPVHAAAFEKALVRPDLFQGFIYTFCSSCDSWKPNDLFNKPFNNPCCGVLPNSSLGHFLMFQVIMTYCIFSSMLQWVTKLYPYLLIGMVFRFMK